MDEHDDTAEVTRRSFARQTGLFVGSDAIFASKTISPAEWLEPLDPESIALDVACGAAHVAQELAPRVRQVVGVDLTPALLELARERLATAGVGNVLLQRGDAGHLPFVDGSFDLVVCRAAMHHFPEPSIPLAEMARVCRDGGRVVVSDMLAPDPASRTAFDGVHRTIDPSHAACLLDAETVDLLTTTVGPVVRRTAPGATYTIPIDAILTDAGDPEDALAALGAETAGGPPTGFRPSLADDGTLLVTFDRVIAVSERRR